EQMLTSPRAAPGTRISNIYHDDAEKPIGKYCDQIDHNDPAFCRFVEETIYKTQDKTEDREENNLTPN
ncbi:20089_t:CDS:1, partial [Racocetra fulgida]